ncbi:MAG: hypothetical protein IJ215_00820 [Clostridia bacterium]|nr:hypothetical protein [Clostridia bacterium]
MPSNDLKEKILNIKDSEQLARFIMVNNISLEVDDEEIQTHFEKYLDFGILEENDTIYDLRDKASANK